MNYQPHEPVWREIAGSRERIRWSALQERLNPLDQRIVEQRLLDDRNAGAARAPGQEFARLARCQDDGDEYRAVAQLHGKFKTIQGWKISIDNDAVEMRYCGIVQQLARIAEDTDLVSLELERELK